MVLFPYMQISVTEFLLNGTTHLSSVFPPGYMELSVITDFHKKQPCFSFILRDINHSEEEGSSINKSNINDKTRQSKTVSFIGKLSSSQEEEFKAK